MRERENMPRLLYLCAEFLVLFVLLPTAYALHFLPVPVIGVLLGMGLYGVIMLARDSSFDRTACVRWTREVWPNVALVALVAAILLVGTWLFRRHLLFYFPREKTALWAAVLIGYPFLSALPQEILYRVFFMHRYASLFSDRRIMLTASSLIFGLHHLVMGNWVAVILSTIAGFRFAIVYDRTRSVWAPTIEHAIYGWIVFTVGLGDYFYHGTIEFME